MFYTRTGVPVKRSRELDGRIEIESALGQGSTFGVLLPAAA
jgi:chemotaxis protein histidine kinase CheA